MYWLSGPWVNRLDGYGEEWYFHDNEAQLLSFYLDNLEISQDISANLVISQGEASFASNSSPRSIRSNTKVDSTDQTWSVIMENA